jgi:hypothetical protein
MLINPNAVEKLNDVIRYYFQGEITHYRRNELAQMFSEESKKLLDQKAESEIKHIVERYAREEITHERYTELIEQVSKEEEVRGAAMGGEYARNRTFDFAQKALDKLHLQAHELSLADAKKQYEIERRKSEQSINIAVQQHVANIKTIAQQHGAEIMETAQKQKETLVLNQDAITQQTKTDIDHIISVELQTEKNRLEREIYEQEYVRPAREASRAAVKLVEDREKELRAHKRLKNIFVLVGVVVALALAGMLVFSQLPQWAVIIPLAVVVSIFVSLHFWKGAIVEGKIVKDKQEVASFKTKSGDYAGISEEDRCALLTQRIF